MRIERDIISQFRAWKEAPVRKPILLKGARQIGKTWAMETFGKECFKYCVKFDFDRQQELKSVFQTSKDPKRLIKELTLYCDQPIVAGETLMIFDEIQECEEALNSLKYFCDEAPDYHIIAAGSLLGVAVKKRKMTVPVGKVKIIDMYPITFKEFLRASDADTYHYIESLDEIRHLPEIIMNKLRTEYRRYQVSGGMPEAVVALLDNQGIRVLERWRLRYKIFWICTSWTSPNTPNHAKFHAFMPSGTLCRLSCRRRTESSSIKSSRPVPVPRTMKML